MKTPSRTASNSRANASARVCAAAGREVLAMTNGMPRKTSTQEKPAKADKQGGSRIRLSMRIFGRHDLFLIGGLAAAVWVVSSHQLGTLLDHARDIDHSRGLQL